MVIGISLPTRSTTMAMTLTAYLLLLLVAFRSTVAAAAETDGVTTMVERRFPKHGDLCISEPKTFTVLVDLYAG
ncbi:hypothetical protein IV203_034313 [Nitzschia inconspicua]|uniref:Uncharacterized protein n=1 Tax=Nitzschia inconspicua TaxID=303405 RepID=A0A9K3Q9P0_9STRA|nr:hypothetical protein IV203_034313 [Nitzschia inconspicua]